MGVIKMKCSICKEEIDKQYHNGEMFWDKGHNAQPINDGRCCTKCNNEVVIPTRIGMHFRRRNFESEHQ